jgi:excisionase family DNA binding protein
MVFTTGEAAQICNVSQQTIIRCFDSGRLAGFRVPGSRSRRIPRDCLIQFMERNGIDAKVLDMKGDAAPKHMILITDDSALSRMMEQAGNAAGMNVRIARNAFEAGFMAAAQKPDVVLIDVSTPGATEICGQITRDGPAGSAKVVGVMGDAATDMAGEAMKKAGASDLVRVKLAHETIVEVLRGVGAAQS